MAETWQEPGPTYGFNIALLIWQSMDSECLNVSRLP